MLDFSKAFEGFASDSLSWRVWGCKLGMRLLKLEQLAEHPVVLRIADLWRVSNVVEVIMVLDLLPQVGHPGSYAVDVQVGCHISRNALQTEFSVASRQKKSRPRTNDYVEPSLNVSF